MSRLKLSSSTVRITMVMVAVVVLFLTGCSTGLHGSFIPYTYTGTLEVTSATELGSVVGQSCQTQPLYILAMGDPATTDGAINDAKNQISGTKFLADLSIDDETEWNFGYSIQCIVVRATAYK